MSTTKARAVLAAVLFGAVNVAAVSAGVDGEPVATAVLGAFDAGVALVAAVKVVVSD
jgi:hypothetical protein